MGAKQKVLDVLRDKGACKGEDECVRCIFDTDCQGFKYDPRSKRINAIRLDAAKSIIKHNPHVYKEEDLFDIFL